MLEVLEPERLESKRLGPTQMSAEPTRAEPMVEAQGGELARVRTFRRKPGVARAKVQLALPAVKPRRSIAQALRDPRTVRDAIVLGSALGPRMPRR